MDLELENSAAISCVHIPAFPRKGECDYHISSPLLRPHCSPPMPDSHLHQTGPKGSARNARRLRCSGADQKYSILRTELLLPASTASARGLPLAKELSA